MSWRRPSGMPRRPRPLRRTRAAASQGVPPPSGLRDALLQGSARRAAIPRPAGLREGLRGYIPVTPCRYEGAGGSEVQKRETRGGAAAGESSPGPRCLNADPPRATHSHALSHTHTNTHAPSSLTRRRARGGRTASSAFAARPRPFRAPRGRHVSGAIFKIFSRSRGTAAALPPGGGGKGEEQALTTGPRGKTAAKLPIWRKKKEEEMEKRKQGQP